mgnify:CR=1 FL=1
MNNKKVSSILLTLCVVFVSCIIMSNVLANETLQVYKWSLDAGIFLFPITYILSDIFSEVYGYKWSRRVTWMAVTLNLIFSLLIILACKLPHPIWFDGSHFELALCGSFRIVLASAISYQCGDLINDIIFKNMKKNHSDSKGFIERAIVSSLGGECVDSTLFVMIAFLGTMPFSEIFPMIIMNIICKTGYEVMICPLTNIIMKKIKKLEDVEC